VTPRHPSKLTSPPPGARCPACWHEVAFAPQTANICPRCFALVGCIVFAPGAAPTLARLTPSDLTRLSLEHRSTLLRDRFEMITAAAGRWRALP
jgi:hypothetical protein